MFLTLTLAALAGPHADQMAELGQGAPAPASFRSGPLPPPSAGPDMTVYGYQAYWDDDLSAVAWDDLTHIALFAAEATTDGGLVNTSRWDEAADAVAMAEPYGVRVHLCVINFSSSELRILLGDPGARSRLVSELSGWMDATGAHGVNIDFEGVPADAREDMVAFTAELEAAVGEVVLATPAVDWSDAWDHAALTRHADLFIMGYGYHWSGSAEAGPNDPLVSGDGTPFSAPWSLSWSVDDYASEGADPGRVILGLPLYGLSWPTASDAVPSTALGEGHTVLWAEGQHSLAAHGRRWEPGTSSPWYWDGVEQGWVGDLESMRDRIAYVRDDTDIAGIGFWALHYDDDDPALWEMIGDETRFAATGTGTGGTATGTGGTTGSGTGGTATGGTATGGTGSGGPGTGGGTGGTNPDVPWLADAGPPFLAYVGDTVILSGAGSTIPSSGAAYAWTQRSGPPVQLDDPGAVEPSFVVAEVGTHVFELRVGDGATWSAPAASHVVVIDPAAGTRHAEPAGCATGAPGAGWWVWVLVLAYIRDCQARPRRELVPSVR